MKHNRILSALIPALSFMCLGMAEASAAGSKPKAVLLDMDALMDTSIDAVESLPDYVNPVAGQYLLTVKEAKLEKFEPKDQPGVTGSRFRIVYAVDQVYAVAKEGELPPATGSLFSESFMGTEDGLKFFKKAAMNILNVTEFGGAKIGEIMEGLATTQFKANITVRLTKGTGENAGKEYENINIRAVHETPAA